jgi:uncharacterized membrane protein (UPF0127 family)
MYYAATIDGVQIGHHIKKADHFLSRLKGLMFQEKLNEGYGLWIVPCTQIHTCFMRTSIDVMHVSGDGVVLYLEKNLSPWRVGRWVKGTQSVLEIAPNTIEQYNIKINQIVIFVEVDEGRKQ